MLLIDDRPPPPPPPSGRPVWEPDWRTVAWVVAAVAAFVGAASLPGLIAFVLLCVAIGCGCHAIARVLPSTYGLREHRQ